MKKILLATILFFALLLISIPAMAEEQEFDFEAFGVNEEDVIYYGTTEPITYTFNEYEYMQTLASKTPQKLKAEGFSTSEISEIYAYEESLISDLKKLNTENSDEELLEKGFNEEQIEIIRDLDSNMDRLAAVGAQCTINAYANYMKATDSIIIVYYDYVWNYRPSELLKDSFGIAWKNSGSAFVRDTTYTSNVEAWYWNENNSSWVTYRVCNWTNLSTVNNTSGVYTQFNMSYSPGYAKEGEGSIKLKAAGVSMPKNTKTDIDISYGHQIASGSYNVYLDGTHVAYGPSDIVADEDYEWIEIFW